MAAMKDRYRAYGGAALVSLQKSKSHIYVDGFLFRHSAFQRNSLGALSNKYLENDGFQLRYSEFQRNSLDALSNKYMENDLVAISPPQPPKALPRLCVVRPYGSVLPLCQHEDDVETDLFRLQTHGSIP